MKRVIFLFIFTLTIYAKSINIAVAANVSYAIDELIYEFNKLYPNIKVQKTIGSSGKLVAQIKHGAPYDIFISADIVYPNTLYKDGLTKVKPRIYAEGYLAIFTTKELNIGSGIKSLTNEKISKIAIANAKTAPYGKATKEALENTRLYNQLKSKFIYGESIGQTLIFTLKAADVGIVAKSLLYSKKMAKYKEGINWIEVDKNLYTPIKQSVALMINSPKEARDFYNFLFSKKAKEIFKSYGYGE